jgi:hypothetical protein
MRADSATTSDLFAETMDAVLRHPRFDQAAENYIEKVIDWRQRLGRFNKVGTNLGFHVINYTMYLHFAGKAGANEHGATYSALLEICEGRKQCGGRALRTALALLCMLGHLRTERSPRDGRVKAYVPSDRLIREATDVYGYAMQVLDELVPGSRYAELIESDPEFLWLLISKSGRAIVEDGVRITEHFPELDSIISQAGGLPTTISLAHADMLGEPFPAAAELAKKFMVSPSQIRSVINAAAAVGLIKRDENGAIVDAQRLVEEHKGLIARELALHVKYSLGLEAELLSQVA